LENVQTGGHETGHSGSGPGMAGGDKRRGEDRKREEERKLCCSSAARHAKEDNKTAKQHMANGEDRNWDDGGMKTDFRKAWLYI